MYLFLHMQKYCVKCSKTQEYKNVIFQQTLQNHPLKVKTFCYNFFSEEIFFSRWILAYSPACPSLGRTMTSSSYRQAECFSCEIAFLNFTEFHTFGLKFRKIKQAAFRVHSFLLQNRFFYNFSEFRTLGLKFSK